MWKPHSVSAITAQNAVVDRMFLLDALSCGRIPGNAPVSLAGEWLATVAQRWGKRVVYSPFLALSSDDDWTTLDQGPAQQQMLSENADLMPDTRFYSSRLGTLEQNIYLPSPPETGCA
jgi:hypothetical protein